MRECGECTLCCKIPRIVGLKPPNEWCRHCDIGKGCKIYEARPQVCKDFRCWWLCHEDMPDEMRPDRVHLFVAGSPEDEALKVHVDTEFPEAWRGSSVVNHFLASGKHVLVVMDNQVTFLAASGRPAPEKIMLEWTL